MTVPKVISKFCYHSCKLLSLQKKQWFKKCKMSQEGAKKSVTYYENCPSPNKIKKPVAIRFLRTEFVSDVKIKFSNIYHWGASSSFTERPKTWSFFKFPNIYFLAEKETNKILQFEVKVWKKFVYIKLQRQCANIYIYINCMKKTKIEIVVNIKTYIF